MLIQQKYDYKPLERISTPQGRRYIVGEDRPLPSVTTILGAMKDMTHINKWKKDVGEAEAERIVTEAGNLGNFMHKNLEDYILGKPMRGGNVMGKLLAELIIKKAFPKINEIWGSEVMLYSPGLYAGTTDLVGLHEGVPAIMDFKNSRNDKKREWIEDYFLQLCAYGLSHDETFGTNIKKGVVMIATRDAKYQEFIIEGTEFDHYTQLWLKKVEEYYDKHGLA